MSAAANLKELQEEGENVQVDSLEVVIQSDAARANAELDKMIAKLTAVSNTIRSTSHLSIGGSSGTRGLTSTLSSLTNASNKAKKSTLSLASAFGKFYASCFLIIRGIKSLGKAINSSMDYIETYNYFNVITDKIGAEFSSAWKENGYSSAEEYADSFRQRLTDLTGKMSGFSIDENGVLSMTDSVGLGLDPEKLMNYQASIASVTNAVGLCGETSVNTSKALSMLAADMSSLKNVDLETVMTNLQSGLIGQSRALYKYGIDITNNTLQQYALANGIDKAVSEMTQAEKMQLRLLAILDQSKVAYGDMANTISSVANQYRMMKQQLSNLARIIGNLFIPMLQKVLPVINGIIIALQRLFTWIGNIFGVDWSGLMDGISSGYTDTGLDEIADSADDVSDSYDAATESAKKFNKQLLSYHELNNLSSSDKDNDSSGSDEIDLSGAISDALGEYQNIWDKAFANMENEAEKWADKITDFFKKIKDTWINDDADYTWLGEDLGEKINEWLNSIDWEAIKDNARKLGKAIATFLNGAIDTIDWNLVGKTIAEGLNTALNFVWGFVTNFDFEKAGLAIADAINGFFQNFDFKKLGETVNTLIQGLWKLFTTAIANISWKDVWKGITDFLGELDISTIGIVIGTLAIKNIGKWIIAQDIIGSLARAISVSLGTKLASVLGMDLLKNASLSTVFATLGKQMGQVMLSGIGTIFGSSAATSQLGALSAFAPLATALTGIASVLGGIVLSVTNFFSMWENGFSWLKEALMVLGIALGAVGAVILGVAAAPAAIVAAIVAAVATAAIVIHDNWDSICEFFSGLPEWFNTSVCVPVSNFFSGLWESVSGLFSSLWDNISEVWGNVADWFSTSVIEPVVGFFHGFFTRVQQIFDGLWIIVQAAWIVASDWFSEHFIEPVVDLFQRLWKKGSGFLTQLWDDIVDLWNNFSDWFNENVIEPATSFFKRMGEKVSSVFSGLWEDIMDLWKGAADWFSETVIEPLQTAWETVTTAIGGLFTQLWTGIKNGVANAMNFVINAIESAINWIVDGINWVLEGFNAVVEFCAKIVGVDWGGVDLVPNVSLGRISAFQTGGFPEDGLFMANHSELVGKFSNGKTAVANNDQIVSGISDGVSSANDKVVSAVLAIGDAIVDAINSGSSVSVDGAQILDVVRNEASSFRKQYGYAPL